MVTIIVIVLFVIRYCIHRWSMRLTWKEEDTEMTTVVLGGGQVQAYI